MRRATLCHKFACVFINFYWQLFYLRNILVDVFAQGGLIMGMHADDGISITLYWLEFISVFPYLALMSGWIQEEYVVFKHLLK